MKKGDRVGVWEQVFRQCLKSACGEEFLVHGVEDDYRLCPDCRADQHGGEWDVVQLMGQFEGRRISNGLRMLTLDDNLGDTPTHFGRIFSVFL